MKKITASAPGKVILFGEHAVVYGAGAIALAINIRSFAAVHTIPEDHLLIRAQNINLSQKIPLKWESLEQQMNQSKALGPILKCCLQIFEKKMPTTGLMLDLWSDLPIGAGLGSSAATSVAILGALNAFFDLNLSHEIISSLAFQAERLVHGTPSGIDNTVSTHGGAIFFKKGLMKPLKLRSEIPILILNTNIERTTGFWVEQVRKSYREHSQVFANLFQSVDKISQKGRYLLERGNLRELGALMNTNQGILEAMGVSTPELSDIITGVRRLDIYGVKITGAGGGGCIIILCDPRKISDTERQLKQIYDIQQTTLSRKGVKIEKTIS